MRSIPLGAKRRLHVADERGATAVEFAIIAAPFLFLLFGFMELCLLFFINVVLEHGTTEAARLIRTGQAQQASFDEVNFKQSVCDELFNLFDCTDNLHIDVRKVDQFAGTDPILAQDADGNFATAHFDFSPGDSRDIVIVRVFYEWSLITPFISQPLANLPENKRLLVASEAFRNEPF